MGDPNGIGAEVIVKALLCSEIQSLCVPLVFGDIKIIEGAKKLVGVTNEINIMNITKLEKESLSPGCHDKKAGEASNTRTATLASPVRTDRAGLNWSQA